MIIIGGGGDTSFAEVFWGILMVICAFGCGFYKDHIGGVILFVLGFVFFINSLDFPAPKKEIEKIIPNENFKIVK